LNKAKCNRRLELANTKNIKKVNYRLHKDKLNINNITKTTS